MLPRRLRRRPTKKPKPQKSIEAQEKAYRDAVQAAVAAQKPVNDAKVALGKTQQTVVAKQTVITTLTEASNKAAEAVKAIPNDAELTQAATIYTNKLTAANTELAALQKTATDQTAAVDTAPAKIDGRCRCFRSRIHSSDRSRETVGSGQAEMAGPSVSNTGCRSRQAEPGHAAEGVETVR